MGRGDMTSQQEIQKKQEAVEQLLASKLKNRVVHDQSVSREMLNEFARLRSLPYLTKDFEGQSSSESTTESDIVNKS